MEFTDTPSTPHNSEFPVAPSDAAANAGLPVMSLSGWKHVLARYVVPEMGSEWRRRTIRYPLCGEIRAAIRHPDGIMNRELALREVSVSGVMARYHQRLPESAPVRMEVRIGEYWLAVLGEIVHCTETIGGYKVGIRLHFPELRT
jgi:hypothetical protein